MTQAQQIIDKLDALGHGSRVALARALGISPQRLNNVLKGKPSIRQALLDRAAATLGLGGPYAPSPPPAAP